MPPDEPVVATRQLSKTYRAGFLGRVRHVALEDASLSVARGEAFAILGPNGSGKTTLLRILLGALRPTAGSASVLGLPPGRPEALARIGYMSEAPGFLSRLTGEETLRLAARLFSMSRAAFEGRAGPLFERFGLARDAGRQVGQYSHGMRKRLALVQALVNDPDLLILDEPAAGLDPESAESVQGLIRERIAAGKTVLFSSHLLEKVEAVATRVCILHRGRVALTGLLADVAGVPGSFDLRVRGADPVKAAELLRGAGYAVDSCKPAAESLQDVFLRLTREAKTPKQPSGGGPE
jgi:ABC-2 type transport system ATP-binding protein